MPEFWEELNAAEDKAADGLASDYLDSVRATISATDWAVIERDLATVAVAEQIISRIDWQDYDPKLQDFFEVALGIHHDYIVATAGIEFGLVDPAAIKWIEEFGAAEVKYIAESQRDAIREIILTGYADGITPQAQARMIRQHIGLDPRRSHAVENFRDRLITRGKFPIGQIDDKAEKYAARLLRKRSVVIAVNEATNAGAQATYESTKDAVARGIIEPGKYEAYRIITDDERLCPVCAAVAGEPRSLPDGVYASNGSYIIKLHILCRCVEGLRLIKMKEKENVKSLSDVVFEAKGLKETETSILSPTVPLVEGVFSGRGFPVLRLYEEFSKDAKWLEGLTIVSNHEPLDPKARRLGQMRRPEIEEPRKRIKSVTEFYKIDLTQRELENIRSKEQLNGSLHFACNLDYTTGEHNGTHYEAIERGPYVFFEYSLVPSGIVTPKDGAGFNIESGGCESSAHGAVNGGNMSDDITPGHEPELKEQLDGAVAEIASLREELNAMKVTVDADRAAANVTKEADEKASFVKKLKPAFVTEADKFWPEVQEVGFLVWEDRNPEKIVSIQEAIALHGTPVAESSKPYNHQVEMGKVWGY